jgi:hypothetical protein
MSRVVDGVKKHVTVYVRGWKRVCTVAPDVGKVVLYLTAALVLVGWPFPVGWVAAETAGIPPGFGAAGATAVWFLLVLQPYFKGLEE